eukprot:CAMPEP_0198439508 /NCGR_PEP_ID=MMETSP1452-20131203/55245_1 /TAXON_ID=1181717 /ORGANISM="Synchroma pusillum, Strain CCMP3072" /LENGTH=104 /DNA_ID=CAMNT_0044160115 /DNA_START=101 /DNA_END=412 /DNA_ORIENTATION=+
MASSPQACSPPLAPRRQHVAPPTRTNASRTRESCELGSAVARFPEPRPQFAPLFYPSRCSGRPTIVFPFRPAVSRPPSSTPPILREPPQQHSSSGSHRPRRAVA